MSLSAKTIIVSNRGREIVSTNYWDSDLARAGYFYLTWNCGAGRLLLPDSHQTALDEMRSAKYVIVSRGPWIEQGGRNAIELLFEDDSASPFCLHLTAVQTDRLLPDTDQGGGFVIAVWTRGGEKLCLPGKYRQVTKIPCLDPWREN